MTSRNYTWPVLDKLPEGFNRLQGIRFRRLQISLEDDELKVPPKVV